MVDPTPEPPHHAFGRYDLRRARLRLIVPMLVGLAVAWAVGDVGPMRRFVAGWDVAAALLLFVSWHVIFRSDAQETRRRAGAHDPGRHVVWFITIAMSTVSFFVAIGVLGQAAVRAGELAWLWSSLCIIAVVEAWLITHTTWTFRYAHLYYRRPAEEAPQRLQFPGAHRPADIDFAYFAFTLGMCFQVSDVPIGCARIRRSALGHALLSFVYNTGVFALTVNLVMGSLG